VKKRKRSTQFFVRLVVVLPLFFLGGVVGYRAYHCVSYFARKHFAPQSIVISCRHVYSPEMKEEIKSFIVDYLASVDYAGLDMVRLSRNLKQRFKVVKSVSWEWGGLDEATIKVEGVRPSFLVNKEFVCGDKNLLLPHSLFCTTSIDALKPLYINSSLLGQSQVPDDLYKFLQNVPDEYWTSYTVSYSGQNYVFLQEQRGQENVKLIVDTSTMLDDQKIGTAALVHEDFTTKKKKRRKNQCVAYDLRFKDRIYAKRVRMSQAGRAGWLEE